MGLFLLWACFLCGFYATASLGLFPCPSRLAGARRRPCAVRNGRWASPLKRLPSTPLLTGLPPRFFRHWRRSAPPPGQGRLPLVPRKKNSPYLVSRLLRPLLRAPPPILARLPRRLPSRRPCGPFFFIAGLASCAFSLPPPLASSPNVKNGPQSRSFAPLPGRDIARRAPLGFGLLVLGADFCPALGWVQGAASRGGAAGRFASPKPGPPARASGLAAGASAPPAKRRPPGAAPVQSTAPRFQGILSCLCMHFSTCAIQMSV